MRASSWMAVVALASVAVVGWLSTQAVPAPAVKAVEKAATDDRDELANKLLERTTLKDPFNNVPLKDVLDFLADKYEITVLIDPKLSAQAPAVAFALNGDEDRFQVSVPAMKNVRLGTIVKHIADQVDGVYLIYPDHIKIVSAGRAFTLTKPPLKAYMSDLPDNEIESQDSIIRAVPLVTVSFNEKPLQEALKDIESRSNRSVILANQAKDLAKTPLTARFANVPVETAVATLAEMAGLKMARKGNVLLVTTEERADAFDPPLPPPPAFAPGLFPLFDFAGLEDLKKKIAELEKSVEVMKPKK